MNVQWIEIKDEKSPMLLKVFDLYDRTFPLEVREPHNIFLRGLEYSKRSFPNNFRFLGAVQDREIVSFTTAHYLAEVNTGFIVYIATNNNVRNHGLGSKTLLKIEELLKMDAKNAGFSSLRSIVLETEMEEEVHTEAEKSDCKKRNRFFERQHYKINNTLNYLQPPLNIDGKAVPLNLFIKLMTGDQLSQKETIRIIRSMYKEKYDKVNKINNRVLLDCTKSMVGL